MHGSKHGASWRFPIQGCVWCLCHYPSFHGAHLLLMRRLMPWSHCWSLARRLRFLMMTLMIIIIIMTMTIMIKILAVGETLTRSLPREPFELSWRAIEHCLHVLFMTGRVIRLLLAIEHVAPKFQLLGDISHAMYWRIILLTSYKKVGSSDRSESD